MEFGAAASLPPDRAVGRLAPALRRLRVRQSGAVRAAWRTDAAELRAEPGPASPSSVRRRANDASHSAGFWYRIQC